MENYIRFDWAMKRLLRDKANYAVLKVSRHTVRGKGDHPQTVGKRK